MKQLSEKQLEDILTEISVWWTITQVPYPIRHNYNTGPMYINKKYAPTSYGLAQILVRYGILRLCGRLNLDSQAFDLNENRRDDLMLLYSFFELQV